MNLANRKRLANRSPSVIASNCLGAIMLHDLKLPFLTPTVNLFFPAQDFLRFVRDLDRYLASSEHMVEVEQGMYPYPVGRLIDVNIHFMHYRDFATAKNQWCERSRRVRRESIVVMMTDRDGCTPEDIASFDRLQYAQKVIFTSRPYPELASSFYIRGFESEPCVGWLQEHSSRWGKRHLDSYDYVSLLNRAGTRG